VSKLTTIYGLFSDPDSAERGLNSLRAAGVSTDHIVVMSPEPFDEYAFSRVDRKTVMPWIAALGGLIGGIAGYLLAWYTQSAYPLVTGGMPIVAKWPTGIVTYELTMLGAILSTLGTLLITARLPNWGEPAVAEPGVSDGKILIGVIDPSDSSRPDFENRLRAAGAEEVKTSGRLSAT
jgi:Protein of unknown function (DUF3341)